MRTVVSIIIGLSLFVAQTSTGFGQQVSLTIAAIVTNQTISGDVRGLTPKDLTDYKVIVYVHTDQWYIHPYAGQGEGKSWASIKPDGAWQLRTVQREFAADSVAAILVKKDYPEPNKLEHIQEIQRSAIVIKKLTGTLDFGKL